MTKLIFIIAPKEFRDEELFIPLEIVKKAGIETEIASTTKGTCVSTAGREIKSDYTLQGVDVRKYDGIVFVGGSGMMDLVDEPELKQLAQEFFEQEKLVSAICIAPMVLANAGILDKISATVWSGSAQPLQAKGAVYQSKPVVRAGRIITADGPQSAQEFGQAIVEYIKTK